MTLPLFKDPVPLGWSLFDDLPEEGDGARDYQTEAHAAIFRELEVNRSTLLVMATGLGKTHTFGMVARDWPGRVLVLAHRDELVGQARERLEALTGEHVGLEQRQWRSHKERIVVGSTQTVFSDRRLEELESKGGFSLIIVDEAHHYVAKRYRAPLDRFKDAKVLGVTATPDRGDAKALGKIFDSVSYTYDIEDGISGGWLVPIIGETVTRQDIDISGVKASGGDLAIGQLDEAMQRAAEGIAMDTLKYVPDRQGIVFTPGVKTAHYIAEAMNRERPYCCASVDGKTDPDERRQIVKSFQAGNIQYLINCQVFTEGFDAPNCSAIILARPTKSRSLFTQMVGRGTRTLPGIADAQATPEERRRAILHSGKPNMLVLDFAGNAGKHSLVTVEDALGGNYTEDEVALAKKKRKNGSGVMRALREARIELQALALATATKVASIKERFNPFNLFRIKTDRIEQDELRFGRQPATVHQKQALERMGMDSEQLKNLSKQEAQHVFATATVRRTKGLCNLRQAKVLEKWGVNPVRVRFTQASAVIDYIASMDWGRQGRRVDRNRIDEIVGARREAGEEG
jgi:superfamily II DNA or RNA helicase